MKARKVVILFAVCLLAGGINAGGSGIGLSVNTPKKHFRVGEPIVLTITVTNTGKERVRLPEPSVLQKTLIIELSRNGQGVAAQKKWGGAFEPPTVELEANGSLAREYDLTRLFPYGLQPGKYELKAKYHIDEKRLVISEAIIIEIDVPSEREAAMVKDYQAVLQGGEYADVVRLGMEFLRKWPNTTFENHVRIQVAFALQKGGHTNESLDLYNRVSSSSSAPDWLRCDANWESANLLYKKGDVRAAVERIRDVDTEEAKRVLKEWTTESGSQR